VRSIMARKGASGCCFGRCCLIVINLIFAIISLAILAFGVIVLVKHDLALDLFTKIGIDLEEILEVTGVDVGNVIHSSAIAMIVLGVVLGALTVVGLCGAYYRNSCLLGVYITLMVIILVAEIAAIVIAVVLPEEFRKTAKKTIVDILNRNSDGFSDMTISGSNVNITSDPVNLAWAAIQIKLKCCGVNDYGDYLNSSSIINWKGEYGSYNNPYVPATCCKLKEGLSRDFPQSIDDFENLPGCLSGDTAQIHDIGCVDAIEDWIMKYSNIIIGIAVAIGMVEMLLIIAAACLCKDLSKVHPRT